MAVAPHSVSLSCRDHCCVPMSGWRCGTAEGTGDATLDHSSLSPRCLMCLSLSPVGPCTPGGQGWDLSLNTASTARSWGVGRRGHRQAQVGG